MLANINEKSKTALDKHKRYKSQYKPNDLFWGIGIEIETYLQFKNGANTKIKDIYDNHKRERYSVNYFSTLNENYKNALKLLMPDSNPTYTIPIYMNSHSFQRTDLSGNHETTYEKVPQPNPKFKGKVLHDILCEINPAVFNDKYKINYTYDGDTIEFITQNFYKATVKDAIKELCDEKKEYLDALNSAFELKGLYKELGPVMYPLKNEPFVSFLTNRKNIAIFNNGTCHLNFTMPTKLNKYMTPENPNLFIKQHKAAIRYIQYLEPLLIAVFGTPDPFSKVSNRYSKASQRCAASRYIGIGTYDTEKMPTGKHMSINVKESGFSNNKYWWYKKYTDQSDYTELGEIGLDINFNKHGIHGTHGIELRFFDWFPEEILEEVMTFIVHLLDVSLKNGCPDDPAICPIWNGLVVKILKEGPNVKLSEDEYLMYDKLFKLIPRRSGLLQCFFPKIIPSKCAKDLYRDIEEIILKENGPCCKYMLAK